MGGSSDSEEIVGGSSNKRGLAGLSVETSAKKSKASPVFDVPADGFGMDDDSDDDCVQVVDPLSSLCLDDVESWTADEAKKVPSLTRLFQSFKVFQNVQPKACAPRIYEVLEEMIFVRVVFSGPSVIPAIFPWGQNQSRAPLYSVLKSSDVESFASNPAAGMEKILQLIPGSEFEGLIAAISPDSTSAYAAFEQSTQILAPLQNRRSSKILEEQ